MRPFCLKFFSLISEIKRIWIRFTCVSLFHYKISLLFFRFFSLILASLHLSNFRFEAKQSEAKFKSIFLLFFAFFHFFHFFSLFFAFFALNFLLRFDLVIFASKRNKAKRNSSLFFRFFHFFSLFFAFFHFFSLNFRFTSIFSLNFCLFYLRFLFRFLVFRIKVNHVKSGFFSLPSERKFSLQFQISLPKRK